LGDLSPCVFNRPINATSALAWVVQYLVPTLRSRDIVVIDNLSSHKSSAVRRAIGDVGAKLSFLRPYSPDLKAVQRSLVGWTEPDL
jgi:transposase